MHKRIVFNIVSRILLIVSFVMLAPLGWAVHDDFHSLETHAFIVTILTGLLISLFGRRIFYVKPQGFKRVNAKDGLAIVGVSWILLSCLGALPFYLSHVAPTYTDAFFETASGFTTTGASVFADIESLPRGILFWRSLTHWLGGMGIIVLYLALLPALGQHGFQLYKAEAPGITAERIEPRVKETAKILWGVYFFLTLAQTLLLKIGGMSIFDALCHSFGTIATGGFSTKNASVAAFGPYIQWVITFFMFLAGINFMLHYLALKGELRAYFKSEEFRTYFCLILFLIPIFVWILQARNLSASPVRDSLFQIVSIITTTGYSTVNFDAWPNVLRFSLVLLMFIGGCGGSTGGGMKVARVFVSIKVALRSIVQAVYPNVVLPIKYNGVTIRDRLVLAVLSYFVIFIFLFFHGTIFLTITESCDLVTAFSATIAALSNIGPGLAKVGATQNYGWVSVPGKWILTFLMLAGRLELYSILILFMPMTWKK